MTKSIVLKPLLSEKTYEMSNSGVYVFKVDTDLNKHEIAQAVAETYNVTVVNVRSSILKGKAKKLYRNRKYEVGRRSDVKKAYVTLKEGDAIPVFAAVEEADEKAEKTSKKLEKAAEKQAKKESKKEKKKEK